MTKRERQRKRKQDKQRHLESRTALSQKNIVDFAMQKCIELKHKNQSLNAKATALRTDPALLQGVVYVSPKPPIPTPEQYQ